MSPHFSNDLGGSIFQEPPHQQHRRGDTPQQYGTGNDFITSSLGSIFPGHTEGEVSMTDAFWGDFTTNSHIDNNPWFDGSHLDSQIYPQNDHAGSFHQGQNATDLEKFEPNFSTNILNAQFTTDIINFDGEELNTGINDASRKKNTNDVCFGMVCVLFWRPKFQQTHRSQLAMVLTRIL
jgi:hypothetical protein